MIQFLLHVGARFINSRNRRGKIPNSSLSFIENDAFKLRRKTFNQSNVCSFSKLYFIVFIHGATIFNESKSETITPRTWTHPTPCFAPQWVNLDLKRKWKHPIASRFLPHSKAARLLTPHWNHADVRSHQEDTAGLSPAFVHSFIYLSLYFTRSTFAASRLEGLCVTGTRIMGEGSLDDQLGEVMWSSPTDSVDVSNSSSSLSTEDRHSYAPGSVSEIISKYI